jgi:hypothetical protein
MHEAGRILNVPFDHRSFARKALMKFVLGLAAFGALSAPALAQFVFDTNFSRTNNIYTNLNEQFPASGTGTPGSGVGTPNATFLFNPATYTSANSVPGSDLATNGATFLIASDANGRDFSEISSGNSLVVPVNQNAAAVYLLMSSYYGCTVTVTFTGADNATETFSNVTLPDFNGGAPINLSSMVNGSPTNNQFDQTVLQVHDVGAGGTGNSTTGSYNYYDLVEPSFILNSQLSAEELTSITLTSNGPTSLLLGVSFVPVPEPAPLALLALGIPIAALLHRSRHASLCAVLSQRLRGPRPEKRPSE